MRVDDAVKEELVRLQGLVQAETGDRLSQSELLARLLRVAKRHEAELLEEAGERWRPPSGEELDVLFAGVRDWGYETDASKIDEVLYGGEEP